MGCNGALSDRKRLADLLSKCAAEGANVHLAPELARVALKELRAFVARASYQLESVDGEGIVTVVSTVSDPKILRAAYNAAIAHATGHTVQIRLGTEIISIDEALDGADDRIRADRLGAPF
jgi:hypothetical protein